MQLSMAENLEYSVDVDGLATGIKQSQVPFTNVGQPNLACLHSLCNLGQCRPCQVIERDMGRPTASKGDMSRILPPLASFL
jgi:hypothetical protein